MKKYLALLLAAAFAAGAAPHCVRAQIEPVPEEPAPLPQIGVFDYPQFMAWIVDQPELARAEGSLSANADIGRIATKAVRVMAENTTGKLQAFRDDAQVYSLPKVHIYVAPYPLQERTDPIRITLRDNSPPNPEHAVLGRRIRDALRADRNSGDSYPVTSEILSRIYDGQNGNNSTVSGASASEAPRQPGIWAALDAFLSARTGIAATETTTRRLREQTKNLLQSGIGLDLDTALAQAFADVHAFERHRIGAVLQILANHDRWTATNISFFGFQQAYEETGQIVHPHPDTYYVIEINGTTEILSAHKSLWQRNSEGRWVPIKRHLMLRQNGTLWVEPEGWPIEALDRKRFVTAGQEGIAFGQETAAPSVMNFSLLPGLWSISPPLPEGWRERALADLASSNDDWKPPF